MVTMKDVAAAAGVAQSTVSYAYGGSHKVSQAQREHIFAMAASLGYPGPNIVGRSLRSGRVGAIGVMVMSSLSYALEDPSTTLLLKGIVEAGELSDVALTLLPLGAGPAALFDGGRHEGHPALRGLVDGLLVHSLPDRHTLLDSILDRELPTVIIDAPYMDDVPFVGIEDRAAAARQMSHLLELGHRRLGVIADRLAPDGHHGEVDADRFKAASERVVRERLLGYADACRAHGVDWDSVLVVEAGDFDRESGLAAAGRLIDLGHVTGIAATSDVMALAVLDVLGQRSLRCPADVSVIGFDDAPAAAPAGLTTMRQPLVDKGRHAARLLFEQLVAEDRPRRRLILPTELVTRASTAAVRGG